MQESFPSTNFAQRAESAQTRIVRGKADLEALELRLSKFERNREALEVGGKDPEAEIRRTRDDIGKVKIEIAHAHEAMQSLFSEERARFATLRSKIWAETCAEVVSTSATKLAAAATALRSISDAISDQKSLSQFDEGIKEMNRLVSLYRVPSNCGVSPSDGLESTLQGAVRSALASSGLDKALEELRVALKLAAAQPNSPLVAAAQKFGRHH